MPQFGLGFKHDEGNADKALVFMQVFFFIMMSFPRIPDLIIKVNEPASKAASLSSI
jgi:hypothetical protein